MARAKAMRTLKSLNKVQMLSFKICPADLVTFSGKVFCLPWAFFRATSSHRRPVAASGEKGDVIAQHLLFLGCC